MDSNNKQDKQLLEMNGNKLVRIKNVERDVADHFTPT